MADVNISKYRASVVRSGSTPATPGFVVSEGQNPVEPAGSEQNHLPVTINATANALAITTDQVLSGAGTVGQYIRGDGSLADFPASTGGGSSVSYYLNGSISQGTIGGVAYKELSKTPILGAGTQFTINADGYIASFLTDAGDPNLLEIPGGNWNFETYFSASSGGGSPTFYVELYKYDGSTFTLIASNSGSPELIAFGTNVNSYFSTLAVPTTALTLTDRLAIRYYVTHSGRTITLHTENNTLCQIITTFTTGLTALNGLTAQVQYFAVGTSGTDFNIASATQTHTFNLPTASASNRGALSSADWSTFNAKQNALTLTTTGSSGASTLVGATLNVPTYTLSGLGGVPTSRQLTINGTAFDLSADRSWSVGTVTSVGLSSATSGVTIGNTPVTGSGTITLAIATASGSQQGLLSAADWTTFNNKQNALTNPVTGTGTTNYLPKFTGTSTIGNSIVTDNGSIVSIISGTLALSNAFNLTGRNAANTLNIALIGRNSSDRVVIDADGYGTNIGGGGTVLINPTGGNVLIGTTTDAGYKLDVNGTGRFSGALNITTSSSTALDIVGSASSTFIGLRDSSGSYVYLGSDDGDYLIQTPTSGYSTKFIVKNSGNVGIGTSSPISGGGDAKWITLDGNSYGGGFISSVSGTAKGYLYYDNGTATFAMQGASGVGVSFLTSNSEKMRITTGGNVLVGTTTDSGFKLDVNGTGRFSGALTGTSASFSGNITFGTSHFIGDNAFNSLLIKSSATESILLDSQDDLLLQTNGTTKLIIKNGGNVGIGTASPASKLHVNGNITLGTSHFIGDNAFNSLLIQSSATENIFIDAQDDLLLQTNGTTKLIIKNGGNVGIGTTSPYANLDLGATGANNIILRNTTSAYNLGYIGNAGGRISIGFSDSNSSLVVLPYLSVLSSGNVLIGTTTDAGFRLQVHGADGTSYLKLTSTVATTGGRIGYNGDELRIDQQQNADLTLRTNGSERMRITSGGNVGIGTTSPAVSLHIQKNSGTYELIQIQNNSAGALLRAIGSGGGSADFGADDSAASTALIRTASTERMRITSSGNVLIGTTTDVGAKLYVNGTIRSNDTYGFAIGSIASYRRIQYGSDNATSFTLLTDGNAYAGLYALSANFSSTIKTGNPTGSTSDNWLLGRALVSGSSTPDRWIRVQIGNLYYDILAVYMGSV
jgi:hypothetical protein